MNEDRSKLGPYDLDTEERAAARAEGEEFIESQEFAAFMRNRTAGMGAYCQKRPGFGVSAKSLMVTFAPDGKRSTEGGCLIHAWRTAREKRFPKFQSNTPPPSLP